jgi:hypothetical protein
MWKGEAKRQAPEGIPKKSARATLPWRWGQGHHPWSPQSTPPRVRGCRLRQQCPALPAALPVSHPARGLTGASAVWWPACGLRGWPAAGQLWRGGSVGLRRGRPGGAQGVHARRGGGIRALAWPRYRRACARTEPPPASHPSALSPFNMEAPPRVPEGCNRPMTTVPDVCSPSASGLRLRPAARPAWSPPALTSRWRGVAAEGNSRGGHGHETGRRWRVGSREKWLYFSFYVAAVVKPSCVFFSPSIPFF